MATNNMQENLKKYFYSGVGLAAHTAEIVQKSVHELVQKGKLNEADGKRIVENAMKKVDIRRPDIESKYNAAVHKFVTSTASEVAKLQKQIEKLERQLKTKGTSVSAKAAPAKKAVTKVKTKVKSHIVKKGRSKASS